MIKPYTCEVHGNDGICKKQATHKVTLVINKKGDKKDIKCCGVHLRRFKKNDNAIIKSFDDIQREQRINQNNLKVTVFNTNQVVIPT